MCSVVETKRKKWIGDSFLFDDSNRSPGGDRYLNEPCKTLGCVFVEGA